MRVSIPERVLTAAGQHEAGEELSAASKLQQVLGSLPGVTKIDEIPSAKKAEYQDDLSVFRLYADDAPALISQVVHVVTEWNAELRDLHLVRPSLEDVFIYLTGRKLRS